MLIKYLVPNLVCTVHLPNIKSTWDTKYNDERQHFNNWKVVRRYHL